MSKKIFEGFSEHLKQVGASSWADQVLENRKLSSLVKARLKGLNKIAKITGLSAKDKDLLHMMVSFESLPISADKRMAYFKKAIEKTSYTPSDKSSILLLLQKFQNKEEDNDERLAILKDTFLLPYVQKGFIEILIKSSIDSEDNTADHIDILKGIFQKILHMKFSSDYGKNVLMPKSIEIQELLLKHIKKLEKEQDIALSHMLQVNPEHLKELKKKLKKAEAKPDRGIETLFRLASKNLYTRARLVDAKSSIMISVNAIILSIVLGSLYPNMEDDPHLIFAIVPLFLTNLSSIAYAIFAARPKLRFAHVSLIDVKDKKAQLLSFDDFFFLKKEEYEWAMEELMNDASYLYKSLSRDIYDLGKELGIKYGYIRNSYNIFLGGLALSVGMFLLCHWMY